MELVEIQRRYNITTNNLEDIKAELKRKLKKVHPDNKSNSNVEYSRQLIEDIRYVEELIKTGNPDNKSESDNISESGNTLVPVNEVMRALAEILPFSYGKVDIKKEKLENELSVSVENQIKVIKRRSRISRFTSVGIFGVISFLWAFPNQALEHPLIKMLFRNDMEEYLALISLIWFIALTFFILLWFKAIRRERMEREIVDRVKLESVQDRIFMVFLDSISPKKQFTKLDFMEYLAKRINNVGKMELKSLFLRYFHLQENVIQNMADIILLRAKEYKIIKAIKSHGLIECYEIIQDE